MNWNGERYPGDWRYAETTYVSNPDPQFSHFRNSKNVTFTEKI